MILCNIFITSVSLCVLSLFISVSFSFSTSLHKALFLCRYLLFLCLLSFLYKLLIFCINLILWNNFIFAQKLKR